MRLVMMIQRMIAPRPNDEQADVEEIFDEGDRTIKCYEGAGLHLLAEVG